MEKIKLAYNYPEMEENAARIERELPNLIQAGNWELIAEIIKVPESAWYGPAANNYREACEKIVAAKDSAAVLKTPNAIRNCIEAMKERDKATADMIREKFSSFPFPNGL